MGNQIKERSTQTLNQSEKQGSKFEPVATILLRSRRGALDTASSCALEQTRWCCFSPMVGEEQLRRTSCIFSSQFRATLGARRVVLNRPPPVGLLAQARRLQHRLSTMRALCVGKDQCLYWWWPLFASTVTW